MVRFVALGWLTVGVVLVANSSSVGEQEPQLIQGWGQIEDPDGDCKISAEEGDDGKVTFRVPGTTHDLWPGGDRKVNAPRILQDAEGDFTVQVQVASSVKPEDGFFRAGTLLIWQDDKTFIRLDSACAHRDDSRFDFYCYLHVYKDADRLVNEHLRPLKDQPTDLRLERRKDKIVASFSQDGGKTWTSFGEKTVELPGKLKVGVAAVNATKSPFTVTLANFKVGK
jgi:regulation of enolase protein 1 (concanavalin A-like superfamily)